MDEFKKSCEHVNDSDTYEGSLRKLGCLIVNFLEGGLSLHSFIEKAENLRYEREEDEFLFLDWYFMEIALTTENESAIKEEPMLRTKEDLLKESSRALELLIKRLEEIKGRKYEGYSRKE